MRAPGFCFILLFAIGPKLAAENAADAEQTYFSTCVVCHGDDGSGNMPGVPDLAESQALFKDSELEIVSRIKSGIQRPGGLAMPPKGGNPQLTDRQLLSVLQYVKRLVKP